MRVYHYTPPAGTNNINGGTWTRIGTGGPFSDAAGYGDASLYSTIRAGVFVLNSLTLLFARQRDSPGASSLVFYAWGGAAGWTRVRRPAQHHDFDDEHCSQPSCYLDLQTASLAPGGGVPTFDTAEVMGRTSAGVFLWPLGSDDVWQRLLLLHQDSVPFGDDADGSPDCPFSVGGATGAGSGDCVGSSPSYYETLQAANIDGQPGDELLARASDGLRVRKFNPASTDPTNGWEGLPTLTALSGAASSVQPGMWGSIRAADLNGDSNKEVLFLDGNGLQVWSYDPAGKTWNEWDPTTPLALASDPWLTHPEYYSTIQVGDVNGDGRDDVVARGPYGIRTWFYNRRGTGGWERYLPGGYPAFLIGRAGAQGRAAFTALNTARILLKIARHKSHLGARSRGRVDAADRPKPDAPKDDAVEAADHDLASGGRLKTARTRQGR